MVNNYAVTVVLLFCSFFLAGLSFAEAQPTEKAGWASVSWAPVAPPRADYTIEYRIDAQGALAGSAKIRFKNDAKQSMSRVALSWDPASCATVTVVAGGKEIAALGALQQRGSLSYLVYELPKTLQPGQEIELQVTFSGKAARGLAGNGPTILLDWHPRLYWGFPSQDGFAVKVQAPEGAVLVTSGIKDSSGYYRAKGIRSFGLVIAKGMTIDQAQAGDVLVQTLHTEKGTDCAKLLLASAVDIINFYRQHFGFYPFKSLTIIPGMNYPAGGYPVATNIVAVHGQERLKERDEKFWRWIPAHEIGHQYWSEYVMPKDITGANDLDLSTLMIGLGIYADREYSNARGGLHDYSGWMADAAEAIQQGRDTTVALPMEQLNEVQLADQNFRNNGVTHPKGLAIISALADLLGAETFNRIYRNCLKDFGGRRMGTYDLQMECEKETGQDLAWFFDQWFSSNHYPAYEITRKESQQQGSKWVTQVEVKSLGTLQTPVAVAATFEDGTQQVKYADRLLEVNKLQFESQTQLKDVKLDPSAELMLVSPPYPVNREVVLQAINGLDWSGSGEKAKELFGNAQQTGINSAWLWYKLGMCLFDGAGYDQALESFERATLLAGANSPDSIWLYYVWQGHVLDMLGQRPKAIAKYQKALPLTGEHSNMQHSQYQMVVNRHWIEARLKTPLTESMIRLTPEEKALIDQVNNKFGWSGVGEAAKTAFVSAQNTNIRNSLFWYKLGVIAL